MSPFNSPLPAPQTPSSALKQQVGVETLNVLVVIEDVELNRHIPLYE